MSTMERCDESPSKKLKTERTSTNFLHSKLSLNAITDKNLVEDFSYNPIQLGEFSLSSDRTFFNGATIPTFRDDVKLPINLNHGFKDWNDLNEVPTLNALFKWVCENNFVINNVNLLTYRGLLKKIAVTMHDVYKNDWCVRLSKIHSTVIMDEIETEAQKFRRANESEQQKRFQYYGHQFEKEILDLSSDQKESDIVVTSKVGKLRCLLAAEVDGRDKTGNLVEIKTHRTMFNDHHRRIFEQNKLLNTYIQCYLVGINHTFFGFRDQKGYVTHTTSYSLPDIEERCAKQWNKDAIMCFLSKILQWALDQIETGKVYHLSYSGDDSIRLKQVENVNYLPGWFIEFANKCYENRD